MATYVIADNEACILLEIKCGPISDDLVIQDCYSKTDEQWIALLEKRVIPPSANYLDPNSIHLNSLHLIWESSNLQPSSTIRWTPTGSIEFDTHIPYGCFLHTVTISEEDAHRVLKLIVEAVIEGRSYFEANYL